MGLANLFQKKTNYFDKKIEPKCGYCQYGKRTKEGSRILCSKVVSLKEENDSCSKFIYSPLKRIPVKQLNNEGAVSDDEMYVEINDEVPAEDPKKEEPAPAQVQEASALEAADSSQDTTEANQ